MTRHEQQHPGNDRTAAAGPLDPWMLDLVREVEAETEADVEVPREMMWARIQRERAKRGAAVASRRPWYASRQMVGAAAVLVAGVAIGRYLLPSATSRRLPARETAVVESAGAAPMALSVDPSFVAMQEHLRRTVALLTTVRDESVQRDAAADLAPRAKELLSTTRLLLDQPPLRDERTRRLLQDLELVLVQVIQARSTAPETRRAPQETLRETNLLTRVNALVTASTFSGAAIQGGD